MGAPNDAVVANRRRRLKQWIDERHGGSQAAFIASTADGERQLNQGELSSLLRDKSFGEKKARSLETQAGMPAGYLDTPPTADPALALSPELLSRYNAADPATQRIIQIALLSDTDDAMQQLSPSIAAMVRMLKAAVAAELGQDE